MTRLPAGHRVDSVDLHEAPAVPERPHGLVGAVAGRAIQGLRLNKNDPAASERVENLLDQERANASTTAVPVDSRPRAASSRARQARQGNGYGLGLIATCTRRSSRKTMNHLGYHPLDEENRPRRRSRAAPPWGRRRRFSRDGDSRAASPQEGTGSVALSSAPATGPPGTSAPVACSGAAPGGDHDAGVACT